MEAGETMVEVIRPSATLTTSVNKTTTASGDTHEGIKQYYVQKIEELQVRKKEIKRIYLMKSFSSMSQKKVKIYVVCKPNEMN
jgi:hypothetical protein